MDLSTFIISVFCLIDDRLKGHRIRQRGPALKANAKALTDDMLQGDSSWYVKVDGENVKAKRIIRAQSAPFILYFHPKNPFADFGYVGKKVSVGDGLWVTLPPLRAS